MAKLTLKQEKAVMKYAECGNMTEAYRYAYNTENMKRETINRRAKFLFDQGKIRASLDALKAEHRARHDVTVDSLTAQLEEARKLAIEISNPSACVAAITATARLHGLLIEKRQLETSFRGDADPSQLTDRELAALIAAKH